MRHYILGTDEAGYGPNLGPLVVSCVIWEIEVDDTLGAKPVDDHLTELERRLGPIVAETPSQLGKNGKLLLIGDSKKLYQSGKLRVLADAVLTPIQLTGRKPEEITKLLLLISSLSGVLASTDALHVKKTLNHLDISLCDIKAEMIFPQEFNQKLEQLGNKSTLLTETTLSLTKNAIQSLPEGGDVTVLSDKHGGRNRYADLLYQFFLDDDSAAWKSAATQGWIEILTEGTSLSVYRLSTQGRKIEFRFQAKADRHIPAALASMTAKLLRELAMLEFNRFWQQYLPNLQPTAGYPVDALRFFGQIEETRKKLDIPKTDIWREK